MKSRLWLVFVVFVGLGSCVWYGMWKKDVPRRAGLAALENLHSLLQAPQLGGFDNILVMPQALQTRTIAEQNEFIVKALRDELSAEGIAILQKQAQFGSLTNLFPAEAVAWASQTGVKPDECVAFRLDRTGGLRAEVVIHRNRDRFRFVRVNNVKDLARPASQ